MAISENVAEDVAAYLKRHEGKGLLRFITCGSVDDGKSTLIGRLLYESGLLFEDQLRALEADSRRVGTQGEELDLALLLDGLQAEREQGITIDVAHRYFQTERRKFIVADAPGHEQYTRNMVTGASTADCAVLLIDARKGLVTQTRRHTYLVSLLGLRHIALAINKLDLVNYSQPRFRELEGEYREFASRLGLDQVTCIPVSALRGDGVVERGENLPWYSGPTLLQYLETVEVDDDYLRSGPLRLPVQWVNRPNSEFRGFAGLLVSGSVRPGDPVVIKPRGLESTVERIVTYDGDLESAGAGQSVTLTLADEIDVSRGDVIAGVQSPPRVGEQFEATLVWMAEEPLLRGRSYVMRVGTSTVSATVAPLKYKLDIDTLDRLAAETLELNEIGVCELELDQPIAFDPYAESRDMGGFVLIDRISNQTLAAGMINFELSRSKNVSWQNVRVGPLAHARQKGQRPCAIWLTGISGAGKSTIANLLEDKLHSLGRHTYLLDGDNVRKGLNKDLGFTDADRVENVRRVAEVARLMVDAGLIVVTSFISPFASERQMARELFPEGEFIEVFVDTPLEVAEARDPKHLYARARLGELENFTGIDSAYQRPEAPELHIETVHTSPEAAAEQILEELRQRGRLGLH
ncbi:MAG TPA: sulfate adenylyltransferase subunit CysN [Solirubrobacteraceae bacterium]|nr:sulfate adenylyltransferase subunit CysN [Solirubrobacteraceae bacterium]